jgi:lysophospholipase L1-like esterase
VDGQMTLAPNSVQWAANDSLEEPHYYQEAIGADTTFVGQTTPRSTLQQSEGIEYELSAGPSMNGWTITNAVPVSNYLGNGGTHTPPVAAYQTIGIWRKTMDAQAGEQSVFSIHCNSHGCGKWNSGYDLFELDSSAGVDTVSVQPMTSTLTMNLRGAQYGFSPQAFTAGTVNATTLNATTLNAAVSAANITSGTISAARLPLFGPSGSGHAVGAVPDPGATAGTTRYLREDGAWAAPTGSSGGTTGTTGTALPVGATADYNFLQGSGAVLTDSTGIGNNGTLGSGALAPTWTATGMAFSGQQQVALPASLNGTQTFFIAAYINPLSSGTQPTNAFPMFVGSSMGGTGLNLLYAQSLNGLVLAQDIGGFAPSIFADGNLLTGGVTPTSGFHVFTYVLGTGSGNLDHLYIDGVEQPSYDKQFASAGLQTSGNLFLGSSGVSPFTASGLQGAMYRVRTYPVNTLTASQIQLISGSIRSEVQSRGVAVTTPSVPQVKPTLNCIGDSITVGFEAATPYCSLLTLTNQPAYTITNWGISGVSILAINGSEMNRVAPRCTSIGGPANALVFAGTNDFTAVVEPVSAVFANLMAEVQTLKTAGCRVFVGTMLSRTGSQALGTLDSIKDSYDGLILSQAKSGGADGVVDFAANPLLGADGAFANLTYFNTDGTHPTTVGQGLLASAFSNVLNYTYGFNGSSPNVVTATSYQMLSGDGAVTAAPTANAAYTAPDCVGPSGAEYVISNPQSAFTVSIVGKSGQPINGLTTPIVIPSNGSVTLRDVPNPKNVSGCHWVM